MGEQFYITLPSNTHEGHTASNFRVTLPQRLKLEGEWEVGLSEIIYPYSFFNLKQDNYIDITYEDHSCSIPLKAAYYKDMEELLKMINNSIQREVAKTADIANFHIRINPLSKKIIVDINSILITSVGFSENISYLLGFPLPFLYIRKENDIKMEGATFDAPETVHFGSIFDLMYIYCNLVEDQLIGNDMAPLLRIIDIKRSHFGDIVCKTYETPHYVPVLLKHGSIIEINIKNDMNELYKFEAGKVIVKLHLRKRSLY